MSPAPATLAPLGGAPPTGAPTSGGPSGGGAQGNKAPTLIVPFTRAAHEHVEPIFDSSFLLGANTQLVGPFDIPAYGYLRHLIIQVNATGGVGGGATVAKFEDAPWSIINEIVLNDVNGAPIVGPISGFDLFLANKYGGYAFLPDPTQSPVFSDVVTGAGASGNFAFLFRVPIEISNRDALGALPNQAASSTYKCRITMANSAGVYTTAPATTLPTVRFRVWMEAWTQPNPADLMGRPQQAQPPDTGTTQFWTKSPKIVNAGNQTVRLDRMGNLIRTMILVQRNATPVRSTTDFPDPLQLLWDGRVILNLGRDLIRHYMTERYGIGPALLETGVFVFDFTHDFDGHPGGELRDLWLPTTQASRVEMVGTFANAGTLTVLTNDVQPVGDIYVATA